MKLNFNFFVGLGVILNTTTLIADNDFKSPLMGWSSWNTYGIEISETLIKDQADAMVEKGLQDAGYKYINIDDGYFGGRDSEGNLLFHKTRFPNGLSEIVEYIHAKGLKAGIYSDAGENTCASFWGGDEFGIGVGLYGYDQKDMDLFFKDLNFDFIKVDFCGGASNHNIDKLQLSEEERYREISQAIINTGKEDVIFNVCRWAFPGTWVHETAYSWRTTEDIYLGWNSVKGIIRQNLYLSAFATNGRHNDMDMLEVGRGLTVEEDKTHFGMWCIMSSPLLIGCDMGTLKGEALELLTNKDLISLNQDKLSLQAHVVKRENNTYVLVKDIETLLGNKRAVALYNPTDAAKTISIDFIDLDLGGKVKVRDLMEQEDKGEFAGMLSIEVPAHGTRIYKLEAEQRYERSLYEAETAWLSAYQELENNQSKETAIYSESDHCSGGAKTGWLGKSSSNDLQWKNVYSKDGGNYTMSLSYICNEDRDIYISVNGEEITKITVNSGSWDKPADTELKISLNQGNNVIRLYNASSWMPDIDCMTVSKKNSLEKYKNQVNSLQLKIENINRDDLTENIYSMIEESYKNSKDIDENEESYLYTIDLLESMIELAEYSKKKIISFEDFKMQCYINVMKSHDSEYLEAFKSDILFSEKHLNEACSIEDMDLSLETLKNSAKTFLKSNGAMPLEGEALDMSVFIENPTFDTDTKGWANSPSWGAGVAEFWNRNFETFQEMSGLKSGSYTIMVSALYRTGENDKGNAYINKTEVIPAFLYANNEKTTLASLYSFIYDGSTSDFGSLDLKNGYINSMYAANKCFEMGYYINSIDVEIIDGILKIGILNNGSKYDSWCCFDNFSLLYNGKNSTNNIVNHKNEDGRVDVYSVNGVLLKKNVSKGDVLNEQSKEIYIINGEKFIVK